MISHTLKDVGAYFDDGEWNYGMRVLECEQGCGYAIRVPVKNKRLKLDEKLRLSYEREIQDAIDLGMAESDPDSFDKLCRKHIRKHYWSSEEWFNIVGIDLK